jgi:SAM-dependent methyltransferase
MNFEEKLKIAENLIQAERAAAVADKSWNAHLLTKLFEFELLFANLSGENILELGSAEHMLTTRILNDCGFQVNLVDFDARRRPLPEGVKFTKSDWTEFAEKADEKYSDILFMHGLEHIEDGEKLLSSLKKLLADGGRLHVIVPNALSLHRLIGVELGMLETPHSLNENDIRNGHVRLYDMQSLTETVISSGYRITAKKGIQLKALTDSELFDKGDDYIRAMNRLSDRFADYCSELYVCAEVL